MIKYIQNATGCKLDMKRDVGTVLVTGPPEGVAQAEALIREVIENGDTRDKGGLVPGAPVQVQVTAAATGGYAPRGPRDDDDGRAGAAGIRRAAARVRPRAGQVFRRTRRTPRRREVPVRSRRRDAVRTPRAAGWYGHPGAQQGQPCAPGVGAAAAGSGAWGQQHAAAPTWGQQQQVPGLATQTPQTQTQQGGGRPTTRGSRVLHNPATGETQWA